MLLIIWNGTSQRLQPEQNNTNHDLIIIEDELKPALVTAYEDDNHDLIIIEEELSQVVHNLLDNAMNFTKYGLITVSLSKKAQMHEWNITIKDNGKGIDSEIMPRLFTKFATKSEPGMGLGLYISKSITEAHGGRIWAENNPDDVGATFGFSLPVAN